MIWGFVNSNWGESQQFWELFALFELSTCDVDGDGGTNLGSITAQTHSNEKGRKEKNERTPINYLRTKI